MAGCLPGTRVRVVNNGRYPYDIVFNEIGTIRRVYPNNVAVKLDNAFNAASAYGCFHFNPEHLEVVKDAKTTTKNETIMEENNMQKITNYLNIAKVQFCPNTTPFECASFEALNVGDLCVVKHGKHTDFDLATVVEIVERNDLDVYNEVVSKVDTAFYDERVANRAKAAELKAKMEARAKQLQDIALYRMLGETDPDMMALLAEYEAVPKM